MGMFDGSTTKMQPLIEASKADTAIPTPIPEWNQKTGVPSQVK